MKVSEKKALKIKGMFELLNKILEQEAVERLSGRWLDSCGFTSFSCEFHFFNGMVSCSLTSEKKVARKGNLYLSPFNKEIATDFDFGYHEPIATILYDDFCKYEGFSCVVAFVRAAIKNNGLKGMRFGKVEVKTVMTDYLDFEVE